MTSVLRAYISIHGARKRPVNMWTRRTRREIDGISVGVVATTSGGLATTSFGVVAFIFSVVQVALTVSTSGWCTRVSFDGHGEVNLAGNCPGIASTVFIDVLGHWRETQP